jgi:hypothetical protein
MDSTFKETQTTRAHECRSHTQWTPAERTAYAWLFNLCNGPFYALLVFLKLFGIHGGAAEMRCARFSRGQRKRKPEHSYLSSNQIGNHDLRHLGALIQQLLPYAAHLFRRGLSADEVILEDFGSVPRSMRLCFLFEVPAVLMAAVFHHGHEPAKTFRFVAVCARLFSEDNKVGVDERTWCSWLSFLLELPELTAAQVACLSDALREDGFPVPVFDAAGCDGRAFVIQFLSHNVVYERFRMTILVDNMPDEVEALINPNAVWVPQPVHPPLPALAIVPPPLAAAAEQEHNVDDVTSLPRPPALSTPPQSPLGGANQFQSQQHTDDRRAPSDAEDDDDEQQEEEEEEEPQSDRGLRSPTPAAQEFDEGKQANEESVLRLSAAADEAAAAATAGNAQDHAAAAAHTAAPQADAMTDIPSSVHAASSSTASSSSVAAPSSVFRIARKRDWDDEEDAPSAIRRKLLSPSLSFSPLSDVDRSVKSDSSLSQGGGAAASIADATAADAAWRSSRLAAAEASSRLLFPTIARAAGASSPTETSKGFYLPFDE